MADPQVEEARRLALAQDAARAALTAQATAMAARAARDFTGWYDGEQITAWTVRLVRQIEAVQRTLARSTDAYLARLASQLTGKRIRPVGAVDVAELRANISHAGSYGRAADVYRYQQSLFDRVGIELDNHVATAPPTVVDPVEAAVARVEAIADTDAQLVVRKQSQRFMESQRDVVGWRRVIHPELSRGGSCGLCVAAATRLYGKTEPLPIHARCNCVPMPVYDRRDVADEVNQADLERLYRESGGTTDAASLKRTRYQVTEHGELGPVLHAFDRPLRSREDVKRDSNKPRPKSATEKRRTLERVFRQQEAALPKARELAAADPATWGEYEAKLSARVEDLRQQLGA